MSTTAVYAAENLKSERKLPSTCITTFDPVLFDAVCTEIEAGASVRQACTTNGVAFATFYRWSEVTPEATERFSRAKRTLSHQLVASVKDIGDKLHQFPDGAPTDYRLSTAYVNAQREAASIYRDLAKRLNPAEYGDRSESLTRVESVSYVISLDPTETAKPQTVEVTQVKTIPPPRGVSTLPVIPPKPRLKRAKKVKVMEAEVGDDGKPTLGAKRRASRKAKK